VSIIIIIIGNMHRKIGKDRACVSGISWQTDRHTDVLITILRHRSRVLSKYRHMLHDRILDTNNVKVTAAIRIFSCLDYE